jgi:hypothetical protein
MSGEKQRPPGPPPAPIVPGHLGAPSRDELKAMVATLGVFEWCEANGLLEEWSGELRRARDAFMFAHGPIAERWREQTGEEPSWSQYAYLIGDNERLREEVDRLGAALAAAVPGGKSIDGAEEQQKCPAQEAGEVEG